MVHCLREANEVANQLVTEATETRARFGVIEEAPENLQHLLRRDELAIGRASRFASLS